MSPVDSFNNFTVQAAKAECDPVHRSKTRRQHFIAFCKNHPKTGIFIIGTLSITVAIDMIFGLSRISMP